MRILVADDEKHIRRILKDYLENEGYEVKEAANGIEAVDIVSSDPDINLILLDIRMPKMDGFEAIIEIKQVTEAPVLFLTALDETFDEVKGLTMGADDYIIKPFAYEVLMARVKRALARVKVSDILVIDNLQINLDDGWVSIGKQKLDLTKKEYNILELLVSNEGKIMDRDTILNKVWGFDYYKDPRTVDTHMKTLRGKLGDYSSLIKTVRGVGYRFEKC